MLLSCFIGSFQSAPPVKGATLVNGSCQFISPVSIRAPREGGDFATAVLWVQYKVSIRAPREGGDTMRHKQGGPLTVSIRAPREGGDSQPLITRPLPAVSIRAPREGGDHRDRFGCRVRWSFNPRPP